MFDEINSVPLTHYEVLEVEPDPDASNETIQNAYKRLSRKYHPDRAGQSFPDLRDAFTLITKYLNQAKTGLSSIQSRQQYHATEMRLGYSLEDTQVMLEDMRYRTIKAMLQVLLERLEDPAALMQDIAIRANRLNGLLEAFPSHEDVKRKEVEYEQARLQLERQVRKLEAQVVGLEKEVGMLQEQGRRSDQRREDALKKAQESNAKNAELETARTALKAEIDRLTKALEASGAQVTQSEAATQDMSGPKLPIPQTIFYKLGVPKTSLGYFCMELAFSRPVEATAFADYLQKSKIAGKLTVSSLNDERLILELSPDYTEGLELLRRSPSLRGFIQFQLLFEVLSGVDVSSVPQIMYTDIEESKITVKEKNLPIGKLKVDGSSITEVLMIVGPDWHFNHIALKFENADKKADFRRRFFLVFKRSMCSILSESTTKPEILTLRFDDDSNILLNGLHALAHSVVLLQLFNNLVKCDPSTRFILCDTNYRPLLSPAATSHSASAAGKRDAMFHHGGGAAGVASAGASAASSAAAGSSSDRVRGKGPSTVI